MVAFRNNTTVSWVLTSTSIYVLKSLYLSDYKIEVLNKDEDLSRVYTKDFLTCMGEGVVVLNDGIFKYHIDEAKEGFAAILKAIREPKAVNKHNWPVKLTAPLYKAFRGYKTIIVDSASKRAVILHRKGGVFNFVRFVDFSNPKLLQFYIDSSGDESFSTIIRRGLNEAVKMSLATGAPAVIGHDKLHLIAEQFDNTVIWKRHFCSYFPLDHFGKSFSGKDE